MNKYFVATSESCDNSYITSLYAVDESTAKSLFKDFYFQKFNVFLHKNQIVCQLSNHNNSINKIKSKRNSFGLKLKPITRSIKYKRMLLKTK